MKVIKNSSADLEKKRFRFFKVGMIVSCSLALVAFRWTTYELEDERASNKIFLGTELPVELPPVSFQEMIQKSAKKKTVITTSIIDIVDDLPKEGDKKIIDPFILDWTDLDVDGEPGGETPDITVPSSGPSSWMKAERTPYFDDCSSPSDRTAESECTYAEIRNFVQSHTKYPTRCREMGIQGTVWLTFVIDKNGDVVEIEEIKSPHKDLTEAAIKGLGMLPHMNPGTQRLQPVSVRLEIPVRFTLK